MAMDELETFMAAIRKLESGSLDGNYNALGVVTSSGYRARGAYQIMEQYWAGWAAEAGIKGASWRDPAAQDRVARYKFTQYYQKYGDWRLVAIAWFAGPGRADRVAAQGIGSVAGIADANGTTIGKYVQVINENMQLARDAGYGPKTPTPTTTVADRAEQQAADRTGASRPEFANDQMPYPEYTDPEATYTPDLDALMAMSRGNELLPGQTPGFSLSPQTALGAMLRVMSNHRKKFSSDPNRSLGEATV